LAILVASAYYPSTILWQDCIDCYVWRTLCEYFSFKVIKPIESYSSNECYMFVEFPHGIFPIGYILSATVVQTCLSGLRVEGAIASILFRIPFIRQLCHWFGSRPATEKNIRMLLNQGSVGLMAGGIAELFLSSRTHEMVYVKRRKGFIRLALERGCNLVPIYHFGNTQLFDFIGGRPASLLSRRFRASLLLFYGRYYLPLAYQHPVTMVIGRPIQVQQVSQPSEEQVNELHALFIQRLKDLFDEFKGHCGWDDKQLEIQ